MRIWPWSVIADLRREIDRQDATIYQAAQDLKAGMDSKRKAQNQIEYLVRTIRDIDEQIFKMSQLGSWDQMRPHFAHLAEGMTFRKRTESDRINDLLRPELVKAYNDQTNSDIPVLRGPD